MVDLATSFRGRHHWLRCAGDALLPQATERRHISTKRESARRVARAPAFCHIRTEGAAAGRAAARRAPRS